MTSFCKSANELKDRQKDTQKQGTDSITSTARGNNKLKSQLCIFSAHQEKEAKLEGAEVKMREEVKVPETDSKLFNVTFTSSLGEEDKKQYKESGSVAPTQVNVKIIRKQNKI